MPSHRQRRSSRGQTIAAHSGGSGGTASARGQHTTSATSAAAALDAHFDAIIAGDFDHAKHGAHTVAATARTSGNPALAEEAGLVWQVADSFDKIQDAIADQDYTTAKGLASAAATASRRLIGSPHIDASDIEKAIQSAGEVWSQANKATSTNGRQAPIIDQHELPHWNNGAFCGLATLAMLFRANNMTQGTDTRSLDRMANQMYTPGAGTRGSDMARLMRERGLKDAEYITTGDNRDLIGTLDRGQPVPFGVVETSGRITKLEGGSSQRYPHLRVGDAHYHRFQGAGHWVLVTRYEGDPGRPKMYYINDPDVGGELAVTPRELAAMGEQSGNYWMVRQ